MGKGRCAGCHAGFNFTDEGYHHIGVGMDKPNPDLGRFQVTKVEASKGAFKTPTVRDVAKRAPYMHDGGGKTLEDVVASYNQGGVRNPWLSAEIRLLGLGVQEQGDLVTFLRSLTGQVSTAVGRARAA